MGIFSKLKNFNQNRLERKIEKGIKSIRNPKAIKEDRWAYLEFFRDLDDPEVAVPALLNRFEYSLEHGILDTKEKDIAKAGILKHSEKALPHLKDHINKTTRIAWPIKILMELADQSAVIEALVGALNFGDTAFNQTAIDKNYDILCYLRDYKVPGLYKSIAHFVKDLDERVRFAAVEVLIEQPEDDEIKNILEPFLADESAENRRIRKSVIDTFVKRNWRLTDPKRFPTGMVTDGIFVTKKGYLDQRG